VKRLRRENHSVRQNKLALQVAKRFAWFENAARLGLKTGTGLNRLLGEKFMPGLTAMARKILPAIPNWSAQFGKLQLSYHLNGKHKAGKADLPLRVLYFPACISRMMGGEVIDAFQSVCKKAGMEVVFPPKVTGSCCGQIFSSKGFADAYRYKANEALERLWAASEEGRIMVVTDVSSCTQTLVGSRHYLTEENQKRFDQLQILDIVDFAADHLIGRLSITRPKEKVVFHPVCSVQKMGTVPTLQAIGEACSARADLPVFAACCGMAGDRGFIYPELTAAATRTEAAEVRQQKYDGYYSTSKTCELALTEAVGEDYESIIRLLDEVSE
jgi:D-lactate dehydrogenase